MAYLGLDAGQLHIGLIQTSAAAIDMLDAIRRFHERYPAIEVHVEAVHPVSVVCQPARLSAAAREFLAMLALPAPPPRQLNMTEHDS
jgi:hypothetical protein